MRPAIIALTLAATTALGSLIGTAAKAEEFQIRMLNKGENGTMIFEPDFVKAQPGDTIRFLPTDKGHNAEIIKGMLPEGVEIFKSKLNEEYVMTVESEGVYGIKCTPHYAMGMIALISVGEPVNLEEAKAVKHKGKAASRFEDAFARLQVSGGVATTN